MTTPQETTTISSLEGFVATTPDAVFLVDRKDGVSTEYTYAQAYAVTAGVAKSLAALFGSARHKVSILSKNRAHWTMTDNGILRSGNINVPVFCSMSAPIFKYALEFAEVELLFVGEAENWNAVKDVVPDNVTVVSFPGVEIDEADYSFDAFLALGKDTPMPGQPDPDDPCTIIFTSGTTGFPKGVVHSLRSMFNLLNDISKVTGRHSRFYSYLPMAHAGDRFLVSHACCLTGGTVTFNDNLATFIPDLIEAAPTFFLGVPRIWAKVAQGIVAKMGGDAEGLNAKLDSEMGAAVAAQIRGALGLQNLTFAMTSTAPTPRASKIWWQKLGVNLKEGYGQTEILPITMATNDDPVDCGLGRAAPGVEVRALDTGEIICRGPGMSIGYYNNPEKTSETFIDGWVHTGDKGHFDENGYLHITGRVSEIFKTAKGKYVAPAPIEGSFAGSSMVEQTCLYGLGLTQPVMLCCLSETAPQDDRGLVEAELTKTVGRVNEILEKHEKIGGVIVCTDPWTIDNGILTHTMKVKRDKVEESYKSQIQNMDMIVNSGTRSDIHIIWA